MQSLLDGRVQEERYNKEAAPSYGAILVLVHLTKMQCVVELHEPLAVALRNRSSSGYVACRLRPPHRRIVTAQVQFISLEVVG